MIEVAAEKLNKKGNITIVEKKNWQQPYGSNNNSGKKVRHLYLALDTFEIDEKEGPRYKAES